ncbi:MAG TPA: T9SS type A sorting domain-containing protein [Bacteroidia bacterium]
MKKLICLSAILVSGLLNAQTYLMNENFNEITTTGTPAVGPLPTGWTPALVTGFKTYANHGTYNSNACSSEMSSTHTIDTLYTPVITGVSATTLISLQYRFVNANLYPSQGATLGTGDLVTIDAFALGTWHNALITLPNPAALTTFTTYTYACSLCSFAGGSVQLRLDIARSTGDWFIDIDNIIVGDNIAGIEYNALNPPALLVFPNPSNGNFTVWLKNYQANNPVEVTVYNFLGQKVKTVKSEGAVNNQVDVSSLGLEKGMYLVEVKSGTEVANSKIQIE